MSGGWWLLGGCMVIGGGLLATPGRTSDPRKSDRHSGGDPGATGRREGVHPTLWRAPSAAPVGGWWLVCGWFVVGVW